MKANRQIRTMEELDKAIVLAHSGAENQKKVLRHRLRGRSSTSSLALASELFRNAPKIYGWASTAMILGRMFFRKKK